MIEGFDNLEYLFTSSVARDLVMLEQLKIGGCKKMGKVLFTENVEENGNLIFPQLRILQIQGLPKLERFCHGNYIKFPCLSQLLIMSCPVLKTFISSSSSFDTGTLPLFDAKVTFPKLEQLTIKFMESLDKIWDNQLDSSSFCQLNYLSVNSCNKLLNIFPFSMLERLQRLDKLEIRSCNSLEEIFESQGLDAGQSQTQKFMPPTLMESGAKFVFPKLTQLDLCFLHKLKALCHQMHTTEWPSLKKLRVYGCEQVQIFASELSSFRRTNGDDQLEVSLFWTSKVGYRGLENLKLSEFLELIEIWNEKPQEILPFKRLRSLEVCNCNSFRYLLTTSMVLGLTQLWYLKVAKCAPMEQVIIGEGAEELFPNLRSIILESCPNLKCFYEGNSGLVFPLLNKITVVNCPVLAAFAASFSSDQKTKITTNDAESEESPVIRSQPFFSDKVAFPNLKKLELSWINVNTIWHASITSSYVAKLTKLIIKGCGNLKYLFPSSIALGLVQLYNLEVTNCVKMEQVIKGEGAEDLFPKLFTIILEACPNLKCFYEGSNRLEFPRLYKITVVNCPALATFASSFSSDRKKEITTNDTESEERLVIPTQPFFSDKAVLPNLKELQLRWMNVNIKWHTSIIYLCVEKLKKLIIQGCDNLEYLFSSSVARGLVMLNRVEIRECKRMREIIVTENAEEKEDLIFPQLSFLLLKNLQNIVGFYSGNCIVEFPSLKQLQVLNCPELEGFIVKYFASTNVIADKQPFFNEQVAFPNLESLTLTHLKNLDIIWHNQFHANSFGKLKSLTVRNCEKLSTVFPSADMLGRIWKSLEKLIISYCGSLEVVFGIAEFNVKQTHAIIDTKLRELNINGLPRLKYVWNKDPQGILTFHSLELVVIERCDKLKFLFPASIGKSLSQLQKLHLLMCGVEEIVTMGEQGIEAIVNFEFPQLSSLKLERLPRLQCFHPGKHTAAWPKLKKFHFSLFNQVKRTYGSWQLDFPVRLPLFSIEKIISQLEELSLSRHDIVMTYEHQFKEDFFFNVKVLKIHDYLDNESDVLPVRLLQRFCHLEELVVEFCNFEELFPSKGEVEEQEKHIEIETLSRIKTLNLERLPYLRRIWSHDSSIVLQNLETLQVFRCESLISLSTSPAFFQNLVTLNISSCGAMVLEICDCSRFRYLLTDSMALGLVRLLQLIVKNCGTMEQVIMGEGAKYKMEFPHLWLINLESCSDLTSFYVGSHSLELPQLSNFILKDCSKMVTCAASTSLEEHDKEEYQYLLSSKKNQWMRKGCARFSSLTWSSYCSKTFQNSQDFVLEITWNYHAFGNLR
ncbi:hypothetical protein SLEP1_g56438 [Rubroshorea leprosula]|uniref:Disease resistance protein At4g27190-like leucine-rich repeats domain-containing protein n=1 Tax=Rubroshorea leprosula TaxID=152421 RepID=A0AAV5MIB1_9ROSI|nr:hypothetical protein SLEP1_g56438 [Rubroshorea leprosula]